MDNFKDFRKLQILLSNESWQHIHEDHPTVTKEMIKVTLEDPVEVRKSSHTRGSELYYGAKYVNAKGKARLVQVVVKETDKKEYMVTTATIVSKMKSGEAVYKKEDSND